MTFAVLRSLHVIIGDALDEMERVYSSHGYIAPTETASCRVTPENTSPAPDNASSNASVPKTGHKGSMSTFQAYVSPPPSPSVATSSDSIAAGSSNLDFPSLDAPSNPTSLSEVLTSHPTVVSAISQIIAAAGQLAVSVQSPFLTLCDATMGYHLPSCMRLLEASHIVEILREAGPEGLHVDAISEKNGVDPKKLAHILRLLATHHILREVSPDVFTLNRISSLVDSGKSFSELQQFQVNGHPELKYRDTNGIAAFVGLCTDELQKSAAYMTETYYLSPSKETRVGTDPAQAPFCFAFDTVGSKTGFFGWLEGEVHTKHGNEDDGESIETGPGPILPPARGAPTYPRQPERSSRAPERGQKAKIVVPRASKNVKESKSKQPNVNPNKFRLERFGKAMSGTDGWEAPGAVLNGFDWHSLPRGSIVVDVGGGIGSTSILLATAFSSSPTDEEGLGLKFVIQDRPVVCEMGEKAWKAKCPELLESTAQFQVHDFFSPQPVKNAALFLLRVVLHDWPDEFARKILLNLRDAATPSTKLLIADFVLPLACPDNMTGLEDVEGAERLLAPAPLMPNLGKASANVYWMDMTMQVVFNAQERTLREIVGLAASAGWKIVKVTRTTGSLFGYLVAVPMAIPDIRVFACELPNSEETDTSARVTQVASDAKINVSKQEGRTSGRGDRTDFEVIERASSRCGTPTFGSNMKLSSVQEALARFGGGIIRRSRGMTKTLSSPSSSTQKEPPPVPLKPALTLSSVGIRKKAKPSPLSVVTLHASPTSSDPSASLLQTPLSATIPARGRRLSSTSPRQEPSHIPAPAHTHSHSYSQPGQPQPSQSPLKKIIPRRLSLANLRSTSAPTQPPPPLPNFTFTRQPPLSPHSPKGTSTNATTLASSVPGPTLGRRASHAQLSHHAAGIASPVQANQSHTQGLLAPSFIPKRTSSNVPQNGESFSCASFVGPASSNMLVPPGSPWTTRTTIPRRSSFAQLPQPPLRIRSGTVIGTGSVSSADPLYVQGQKQDGCGIIAGISTKSLPLARSPPPDELPDLYEPELGSVLTAAARIEKRDSFRAMNTEDGDESNLTSPT